MTRFRDPLPVGARTFESRDQVQWCDVDFAGIMYFAAYWRFEEHAEMRMFAELGYPYERAFDEHGIWIPRVHAETDYHAPALMGDWLRLRTHVERVGASSIAWRTVVFNERTGEAGAVMGLTVACIDRTTGKSRALPPAMRAALHACLGAHQ